MLHVVQKTNVQKSEFVEAKFQFREVDCERLIQQNDDPGEKTVP